MAEPEKKVESGVDEKAPIPSYQVFKESEKAWLQNSVKVSLEAQKMKVKVSNEKLAIVDSKLDNMRKDPRFKEILLERKAEDLKIADYYLLERSWADLSALFLSKSTLNEWDEFWVDLAWLDEINGIIQANIVIPKNVKEVDVGWVRYTRTKEWFFNPNADEPYLFLKSWQRMTVKKVSADIDVLEKADNEKRYKDYRTQEFQRTILEWIKSDSDKISLPTWDKEDITLALWAFTMLFGFLFKWFGLDSIFKSWSRTLDISNKEMKSAITNNEAALDKTKVLPFNRIFSSWFKRSSSGTTLCSRTAREDAMSLFWLTFPRWDAIEVQKSYWNRWSKMIEPSWDNNVADIFTWSKSIYWHRLLGFKRWNEWYVLDPYTTWWSNVPMRLAEYEINVCKRMSRPIKKIVLYKSEKTVVW